ncbi:hypothetical protein [Edaphobacter albus]|uniref:hypothetical protein n=1 Tax=Edaphobacter sp. 4G125 TaxID=2763071 RepID=UPI001646D08E|nr:hypothetical protein [Edaphobacter sp. 4G125]QNI35874.1 hypothetical protein H7846_12650 [Edaphobacter sp. 4G125]
MAGIHSWWKSEDKERFWLEVTRRPDIGSNLKAPQAGENGQEHWSYSLIKHLRPGDVVFHYDGNVQQIVAQSKVVGEHWGDEVLWAARGTSARSAGIEPHTRPGWYHGLEAFNRLNHPVDLEMIRAKKGAIKVIIDDLQTRYGSPLYFPFEVSNRPMRPLQGYLFKFPHALVNLLGMDFAANTVPHPQESVTERPIKDNYRRADEAASVAERDAFSVDPALVERGVRGHAKTQNLFADFLTKQGHVPRSPSADEPNFDIAWQATERHYVAEVKSLTNQNEEKQMRLGLGQVLRYAHTMRELKACPVLIVERKPRDGSWIELCSSLGVLLVWPELLLEQKWPPPLDSL